MSYSASEAESQGCSIEISIYMSVCRTSKINTRTWVIARASFGVLKAWTTFNRTHAPYSQQLIIVNFVSSIYYLDVDFVLHPLILISPASSLALLC